MTVTVDTAHRSVAAMFLAQVAANPDGRAFSSPTGTLTWREAGDRVTELAAGLVDLGVAPGDRVAIASSTRVEWVLADLAVMLAAGATTTIYPSTGPTDAAFILADSGSVVVFAEDAEQAAKCDGQSVVTFEPVPGTLSLADLAERGRRRLAAEPTLITDRVAAIDPEQLATLIYTSGTTGRPKGVRLVQANWLWESRAQAELGILLPTDVQYLWLPMAHVFGKTLLCAQLTIGFETYVDGRVDAIIDSLPTVRPTVMAGVPRIYEKVYNRIRATARQSGGARAKIFDWAFTVGRAAAAVRERGGEPSGLLAVRYAVADRLVFRKIKERFGGRMRGMLSGAAPLSREVAEFFHAAGLPIYEGYGLTETSAGSYVNRPDAFRLGTVGLPLGDLEVRIASDGEILLRGGGVMRGYHNLPSETAEVLEPDGWFHTGDVGELDGEFLRITDRKKDLVKTSGGKYIAPSYIEGLFKTLCPEVSQVIVHTRNFCSMLITLDPDEIRTWAEARGLGALTVAELSAHPQVHAYVQAAVDQLNGQLNRWEQVKRFVILPRDLSVTEGEITPSLKVRRRIVEQRYGAELDALYTEV